MIRMRCTSMSRGTSRDDRERGRMAYMKMTVCGIVIHFQPKVHAYCSAETLGEGEKMVIDLQDVRSTLAENISKTDIVLLPSSAGPLKVRDDEGEEEVGDDENDFLSLSSD